MSADSHAAAAPRIEQCPPVEVLQIHGAPSRSRQAGTLDPVTVVLQDYRDGRRGRLIVECYGRAWSCWWGNMGENSLRDFIEGVPADYIANCLVRGSRSVITRQEVQSRDELYVLAIAEAVKTVVAETEPADVA